MESRLAKVKAARSSTQFAVVSFALAISAAAAAVYFYIVFLGLQDPFTHAFPASFDYFSYLQYYGQVKADLALCLEVSGAAFAVSIFSISLPFLEARPQLAPLRRLAALLQNAPKRVKTATFLVPLLLLQTGLVIYGGLIWLTRNDLALSVSLRDSIVVRTLFMGPRSTDAGGFGIEQDYYFLALYVLLLIGALYRFRSARRVLQVGSLAIIPLPVMIYFFDRLEFGTFFASALYGAGLGWFSNELLLYLSAATFLIVTCYPVARRAAARSAPA